MKTFGDLEGRQFLTWRQRRFGQYPRLIVGRLTGSQQQNGSEDENTEAGDSQ